MRRRNGLLIVVFALIGALAAVDLLIDLGEGTSVLHIVVEGIVLILAIGTAAAMSLRLINSVQTAREHARDLEKRLKRSSADAERWRLEARRHLEGLGAAIERQFGQWTLSPTEKEVALLLLKGFSHKEIARLRGTSDATARQHARAVYGKAGVGGRHELAGFFLEDLALPIETNEPG